MQQRVLGKLWPVSALTLGGGGIGMVWGETTFDECVATVRAAIAAGINLIDLAPPICDIHKSNQPSTLSHQPDVLPFGPR